MELDGLLSALEERANTARTIFMLLDSDADGLVASEQVSAASPPILPSSLPLSPPDSTRGGGAGGAPARLGVLCPRTALSARATRPGGQTTSLSVDP